ncbi:flavin monoamine oxidase family protein [Coxiella burnetii]|uniref:flavin monoamine oxidase family protein n=1 Tax=Coxiella burnetii TaxID=777 RepID=UPI000183D152|nr:FAD-dependent oxidoreductase [Coxiella burnetii]ACJ18080.1 polyamine oxidase [Coxiella burnetii CbuG_Q212]ATN66483.1 polyamine oxidase [Coxiella burnetii]OYK86530.1 polyamine oxidase [Coxiella burnetii]
MVGSEFKKDKRIFDALIIGADISGLSAASQLFDAGLDVIVLEARNRVGGRIYTDRSHGFPLDLGVSWVHDLGQNALVKTLEELKLKTLPYSGMLTKPEEHFFYSTEGEKLSIIQLEELKKFINHFFKMIEYQAVVGKSVKEILEKTLFSTETELDQKESVNNWIANLISGWTGADIDKVSTYILQQALQESGQSYLLSGYDRAIDPLVQKLKIVLQSPVSHVNYSDDYVEVIANHRAYYAKAVIVTIPIGVLQKGKVIFSPALPPRKQNAIMQIGSGLLNKIIIEFPDCFWEKEALSLQYLPASQPTVAFYVNYQKLMDVPFLVGLAGGSLAETIEKSNKQQCDQFALSPLKKIYGNHFIEPSNITVTQWRGDPYACGAYSFLPKESSPDCFDELASSIEDKLFFAGEATDKEMFSTVQGAYSSGLRAAKELFYCT